MVSLGCREGHVKVGVQGGVGRTWAAFPLGGAQRRWSSAWGQAGVLSLTSPSLPSAPSGVYAWEWAGVVEAAGLSEPCLLRDTYFSEGNPGGLKEAGACPH